MVTDYATGYRHLYLSALTRTAEILEADQPEQAIAILDRAVHDSSTLATRRRQMPPAAWPPANYEPL